MLLSSQVSHPAFQEMRKWIAWRTYSAGWLEMNPERRDWFFQSGFQTGDSLPASSGNRLVALCDPGQSRYPDLSESPAGLLITPEYLVPEWGLLSDAPFQTVGMFYPRTPPGNSLKNQQQYAFLEGACRDAALRAAVHWGGSVFPVSEMGSLSQRAGLLSTPTPMRVYSSAVEDWHNTVLDWARKEHLRAVRVFDPPTGPWRDKVVQLEGSLRRSGISLKRYRRCWDSLHWPHCTGTFEAFLNGFDQRVAAIPHSRT